MRCFTDVSRSTIWATWDSFVAVSWLANGQISSNAIIQLYLYIHSFVLATRKKNHIDCWPCDFLYSEWALSCSLQPGLPVWHWCGVFSMVVQNTIKMQKGWYYINLSFSISFNKFIYYPTPFTSSLSWQNATIMDVEISWEPTGLYPN